MRKDAFILFLSSIALLVGIIGVSFWANYQIDLSKQNIAQTYHDINALEKFISTMKDIETGARGYVLTHNPSFLLPYDAGLKNLNINKQLLSGQPLTLTERQQLNHLFMLATIRLEKARVLIASTKNQETLELNGRVAMDAVRRQVDSMIKLRQEKLKKEEKENQKAEKQFYNIFILGFVIILAMQILTFSTMDKEITEKRKSEEALSKLNQDLEIIVKNRTDDINKQLIIMSSITSNLQAGIIQIDASKRIIFSNPAACKMLGYQQHDMLGLLFNQLDSDSILYEDIDILTKALEDGKVVAPFSTAFLRQSDGVIEVLCTASPIKSDNELFGAVVSFQDLTAIRKAEKIIAESNEQFKLLAESIPQLAWMANASGELYWYNKRWFDYTGTTLKDMQSLGWASVHHSEHVDRVLAKFRHAWTNGETLEDTFPIRSKTGEYRWFLTRAVPQKDEQQNIIRWFGTHTDITEHINFQTMLKERELQIVQLNDTLEKKVEERTDQLKLINKELEAFSYSVSHDLRAPLRSISGFSQALLKQNQLSLNPEAEDFLNRILANAQKMGYLIDDLLQLSRLTRVDLNKENVNLSALAQQIMDNIQDELKDDNAIIEIMPDLFAFADKRLIYIALENLLGNAWKFTAKNSPRVIEFSKKVINEKSVFCIKDNGAGFEMTYVHKLFGAFQRLHAMEEYPGNGIGLTTVQRIIHRHNGEIWAEGSLGKGAAFYFTL